MGMKWLLERTPENLGIWEDKQMSIKLAMNRFRVVSKSLNCTVTFVLLTRHHTTVIMLNVVVPSKRHHLYLYSD